MPSKLLIERTAADGSTTYITERFKTLDGALDSMHVYHLTAQTEGAEEIKTSKLIYHNHNEVPISMTVRLRGYFYVLGIWQDN